MQRTHVATAVVIGFVGSALLASAGCRGAAPSNAPPATQASPAPVMQKPPEAAPLAAPNAPQPARIPAVDPVDFEQLVALIPELPGWTRTKPRGMQSSAGVAVSRASAECTKGDSTIKLEIMDSGLSDLVLAPLSMMLVSGYSERTPEGYKQFAAVAGSPGFESWNHETKEGEVTVVVANRFIVTAKGQNVDHVDAVRSLVQAVDLGKLTALK